MEKVKLIEHGKKMGIEEKTKQKKKINNNLRNKYWACNLLTLSSNFVISFEV